MKNNIKIALVLSVCALSACEKKASQGDDSKTVTLDLRDEERNDITSMNDGTTDKNRKIVERAFDDWVEEKGSLFDLLDENMVWQVTGRAPFSGVYRGKQEFIDKAVVPINDYLSTSIKPELIDINASGDVVWLQWKGAATAVNGDPYLNEYAWKLRFGDSGKIIAVDAFLDTYTLSKLVGE